MKKEVSRKNTRNEIISKADELIRARGFNGFSYADIADSLQIRNAAIHYHFPTKFELGKAVIDLEQERMVQYREENTGLPAEEQLKNLIRVFYHNSLLRRVCLVGSLTGEYATFDLQLREAVENLCLTIRQWVSEFLEKGRTDGCLCFKGDASTRASLVLSALTSALLLDRVMGGEAVFDTMIDQLLEDFGVDWRVWNLKK